MKASIGGGINQRESEIKGRKWKVIKERGDGRGGGRKRGGDEEEEKEGKLRRKRKGWLLQQEELYRDARILF